MRKERAAARKAAKERDELAARLKDIEDRDKTETERNREAAETAARERDEARAQLMRERVARRLQVPMGWSIACLATPKRHWRSTRGLLGAMTAREPDPNDPPAHGARWRDPHPGRHRRPDRGRREGRDWASAIALKARKSATSRSNLNASDPRSGHDLHPAQLCR